MLTSRDHCRKPTFDFQVCDKMASPINRLILQSDWDSSLRETDGQAWISFKCTGLQTEHSDILSHGQSSEGLLYLSSKSSLFNISNITERSVVIAYNGENASLSRRFVSPSISYYSIHTRKKQVTCLDVTSGGLGVSCDSEGLLKVWETNTGEIRRNLEGHAGDVYTCKFFPSHVVALTAGADTMIKIWDVKTGTCATTITGHKAAIFDAAVVDKGRNIVTCSRDGSAKLWDVGKQECLATFQAESGEVNSCSLGIPENSIDLGPTRSATSDREIGSEGKMLLLGCENGSLSGYGLQTREQLFTMTTESAVNTCAFVSEVYVSCGTQDGYVSVLDLRNTSSPIASWKESRGAILSILPHKGGFFVSTGDGSCYHVNERWETTTELTGSDCDPVYRVASDGANIYTSCRDGSIRRYSLTDV